MKNYYSHLNHWYEDYYHYVIEYLEKDIQNEINPLKPLLLKKEWFLERLPEIILEVLQAMKTERKDPGEPIPWSRLSRISCALENILLVSFSDEELLAVLEQLKQKNKVISYSENRYQQEEIVRWALPGENPCCFSK